MPFVWFIDKKVYIQLSRIIPFLQRFATVPIDSLHCEGVGYYWKGQGYTGTVADACVIIPTQSSDTITPHAEAWQGVVWHMLVTDPRIMAMSNKWESIENN